jgi:hypothetical protein
MPQGPIALGICPAGPVPTASGAAGGTLEGKPVVIVIMETPVGVFNFYMPPDDADAFAKVVTETAAQARSGLVKASTIPAGLIPPNGSHPGPPLNREQRRHGIVPITGR